MLTKQQKHVSIIPMSSGEVRSFILMVPSLENKERKKIKTMEAYRQNTTSYLYSQKGDYNLVTISEYLHTTSFTDHLHNVSQILKSFAFPSLC